jgi:hypothetical protein
MQCVCCITGGNLSLCRRCAVISANRLTGKTRRSDHKYAWKKFSSPPAAKLALALGQNLSPTSLQLAVPLSPSHHRSPRNHGFLESYLRAAGAEYRPASLVFHRKGIQCVQMQDCLSHGHCRSADGHLRTEKASRQHRYAADTLN